MKPINLRIPALATLALLATTVSAAELQLLPASEHDLLGLESKSAVDGLTPGASTAMGELDRTPVSIAWRLDPSEALTEQPTPYRAQSREYWFQTDARNLRQGVDISTTRAGALVRISPALDSGARSIDPQSLSIAKDGVLYRQGAAVVSVYRPEDLTQGLAAFPEGSSAFRLNPELGPGSYRVSGVVAEGRYLVHVFEPESTQVLNAEATRDTVLAGQALQVQARLDDARAQRISGILRGPAGERFEFSFAPSWDGSFRGQVLPEASSVRPGALWTVEVRASGVTADGLAVERVAETAVAVVTPSARLTGSAQALDAARGELALSFGVHAFAASRYQLQAVLYAADPAGVLRPHALAQSAAWLEPGPSALTLRFSADVFPDGVPSRYEIRDLRLVNQADLGLNERRARALAVDSGATAK